MSPMDPMGPDEIQRRDQLEKRNGQSILVV